MLFKQIILIITRVLCTLHTGNVYWSAQGVARWRLITLFTMGEIGSIRLLCLLTLWYRS
jgi:cytochrome c oxidase subunit IV